jgi:glycosyltransferase involved in cell wall biosynthesis
VRLALIICFLEEERHLPTLLASLERQTRRPDELLLVDDGSRDRSAELAAAFAARHGYARVLARPPRPPERDRLARAGELQAFCWALGRLREPWDVVAKLDADLELTPDLLAEIERRFEADPRLGIAGPVIATCGPDGRPRRHGGPDTHVEGAARFYRRACYAQIAPLPAILGWDTIDEVRARMRGWRTARIEVPAGDTRHLRAMGLHDGLLLGFRRAGLAAYAYGADPVHVLLSALVRMRRRPLLLAGLAYLAGWAAGGLRRAPRAEAATRSFLRREQRERMARLVAAGRRP